jgi:hypothetical protein
LLGRSGSLADLNRIPCESIRAGRFDDDWTRAFDVVLAQAVRKRIVRGSVWEELWISASSFLAPCKFIQRSR